MALQSSGAITLAQIQTEFGGSNPISLSEYYRNGSYVTSNNTNVPTSGTISMNQFYSGVRQTSGSQTFNAGINQTFTIPSHNQMTIVVNGAGGGGEGAYTWGNPKEGYYGGNGSAGSQGATRTLTDTTTYTGNVGSTFTINVSSGGAGGAAAGGIPGSNPGSGGDGSNGSASTISFNSSIFMTANGGAGGDTGGSAATSSGSGSHSIAGGAGGAGGTTSGSAESMTATGGAAGGAGSVVITWS